MGQGDDVGRARIPLRLLRTPAQPIAKPRRRSERLRAGIVDAVSEARGCLAVIVMVAIIGLGVIKALELFGVWP